MSKQFTCDCGNWSYTIYKVPMPDNTDRDACRQCAQEFDRAESYKITMSNLINARSEQQTKKELFNWGKI